MDKQNIETIITSETNWMSYEVTFRNNSFVF